jgi:putative endonuclease
MTMDRNRRRVELGQRGEEVASRWLEGRGWTIVARNQREGARELDLIAARGCVLAFVEVKSRTGDLYGHPFEAITSRKQREVRRAARSWLASEAGRGWTRVRRDSGCRELEFRFDAVAVRFYRDGRVDLEHLADAWR